MARLIVAVLMWCVLGAPRAVAGSQPRADASRWHPSLVLLFLAPSTVSYERADGDQGAGLGWRLPLRLADLGTGHVAGFLEATALFGGVEDASRFALGARAFHALARGVGPHLEAGVMADIRADVGPGGFIGGGVSLGNRGGSIGLGYRYFLGTRGDAHQIAISYLVPLPL